MRTHILIAAALALSATTVHAAPRSLSAPQSSPVQTTPEAAKPADAPVFKVQSNEEAKPSEQPQAAPQPAPPPGPGRTRCSTGRRRRGAIGGDEACRDTSRTGGKARATGPAQAKAPTNDGGAARRPRAAVDRAKHQRHGRRERDQLHRLRHPAGALLVAGPLFRTRPGFYPKRPGSAHNEVTPCGLQTPWAV